MALELPTLATIQDRVAGDITTRLRAGGFLSDARVRGTLPWVVSWVIAGASWSMHQAIGAVSRQSMPSTATGDGILSHANTWQRNRIPAAKSTGNITATGTAATVIASGTQWQDATGATFESTSSATIGGGGTIAVPVRAMVAGDAGNLVATTVLRLTGTIAGVDAEAVVASGGLTGGYDEESLEALQDRTVSYIGDPPQGGAGSDYRAWARAASAAVSGVFVTPHYPIPGDVAVWIMGADPTDSLPGSGVVSAVQTYLDGVAPVTATVTVAAPSANTIDLGITVVPSNTEVKAAVTSQLQSLFLRSADPSAVTVIANSNIRAAISAADGETSHSLTDVDGDGTGASSITTAIGSAPILGTITWG